jgi:hypothetical protein
VGGGDYNSVSGVLVLGLGRGTGTGVFKPTYNKQIQNKVYLWHCCSRNESSSLVTSIQSTLAPVRRICGCGCGFNR